MEWDTAAAHAIVLESGGIICDQFGKELSYNKEDLHNPPFVVMSLGDKKLRSQIMSWNW